MNAHQAKTVLLTAGGLGVSATYLIWQGPFGPGFGVWVALFGGSATLLAWLEEMPWRAAVARWSGIAVLAALTMSWRAAPELQAVFFLILILSASMVVLEARGLGFGRTRVLDHVYGAGLTAGLAAAGGFPLMLRAREQEAKVTGRAWALVRGLLLAGPPVLIFTGLFASADPAFERGVDGLTRFVSEDLVARLVLMVFFGWIAAGLLRAVYPGPDGNPIERLRLPRIGVEETAIVLGLVSALFTVFVVLQLGYMFGGREAIEAISGLTVAEYARRGFFELVTAAGLVLVLLLALGSAAPTGPGRWVYRSLAAMLVGLVLVVIASAVLRLRLYADSFGLTTDRLYAAAFMVWLTATLLWFATTVIRGRPRRFASGAIAAGLVASFAVAAVNPHALVARTNLARSDTQPVDYRYLWSLGADAIPLLLERVASIPEADRCATVGAALSRFGPEATGEGQLHGGDWRRWNAGAAEARHAMAADLPRLREMVSGCAGGVRQSPVGRPTPEAAPAGASRQNVTEPAPAGGLPVEARR